MHDFILSIKNPPFFKEIFVFIAKSLPCIAFPLFLREKAAVSDVIQRLTCLDVS